MAEYLRAYDLIIDGHVPVPPKGFVLQRPYLLRHLIGERFGYYGPEVTCDKLGENLKEHIEGAKRRRKQVGRHA